MDIGDGILALSKRVSADLVSGDAVQFGVVHRFFRGCLNRSAAVGVVVEWSKLFDHHAVGIRSCENDAVTVADGIAFADDHITVGIDLCGVHNFLSVV
jgi:hypothetical protein